MSVVVTYVRLSEQQLALAAQHPDVAETFLEEEIGHPDFRGAEALYLDKAYQPIAWLLSPLARAEADHLDRLIKCPEESDDVVRNRVDTISAMPIDPSFEAIHGNRSYVDDRFSIGLDPPAVLPTEKVRSLTEALDRITRTDLETQFDLEEMDRLDLCYLDEEDVMDEYIFPAFERLQAFYRAAAENNQVVMVVFT